MKVLIKKSKRYQGYCVKMDEQDESFAVEDPQGKRVVHLVLEDFLNRLGTTAPGFKRQFPRLGMGVYVKYADHDGGLCEGIASTIGGGGLFIEVLKPLPQGIDTRLEFSLPVSQKVITAKAQVVWVRKSFVQKVFYPGMGVKFVDIAEGDQKDLADFIDRFNQQRGLQEF